VIDRVRSCQIKSGSLGQRRREASAATLIWFEVEDYDSVVERAAVLGAEVNRSAARRDLAAACRRGSGFSPQAHNRVSETTTDGRSRSESLGREPGSKPGRTLCVGLLQVQRFPHLQ